MKRYIYLLLALFFANHLLAQFSLTSKKDAQKIKNSILLVTLDEEDSEIGSKLAGKPDKLEHYRTQVEGRNKALKNAIDKYWTFSSKVEYVTGAKAKEMMKVDKEKYVLIGFGQYIDYEKFKTGVGKDGSPAGWINPPSGTRPIGAPSTGYYYNRSTKYSETANTITTLTVTDPGNLIKVYLPNVYPSESDAVYGIQQIQYILNYILADEKNGMMKFPGQIKKNAVELKNLTLLLDKEDLDPKLTEDAIKKAYPFQFKIVSQEEIDKAILSKDSSVAYVQITDMPTGKGNVSAHFVSNPYDGKLYCYEAPTVAVGIKGTSLITYGQRIKASHLEEYVKHAQ